MTTAIIAEGNTFELMSRVDIGGVVTGFTQAAISTITWKAFLESASADTAATNTGSATISTSVFDTLQTDARWKKDPTGYNFRLPFASGEFVTAGTFRIEVLVTPAAGSPFLLVDKTTGAPPMLTVRDMRT